MKQPKALYLLNFISMWENFSYYGMRALLILFLVQVLHMKDVEAFGLYALYTTLLELGGVVGGVIADRFLGLKRCITIGGVTIVLGHLCLSIPGWDAAFFLGLGLIVVGTSLFRSNAAMLLGLYYEENDPRRESGYTLYYTGINIGGFLASLSCGVVAGIYGWHAGFSLAALGMLLGNIALFFGRRLLKGKGDRVPSSKGSFSKGALCLSVAAPVVACAIYYHAVITPVLPILAALGIVYILKRIKQFSLSEKVDMRRLGLYVLFLIIFYACEEQLGSSLTLFAERHVNRHTWLGLIPASSLIMINPFIILIAGPLLSRWSQKLPLRGMSCVGVSFLLLGLSFCTLYAGCLVSGGFHVIPLAYVVGAFMAMALGELFIAPIVYAYASQIAPKGSQGLVMGIVTMGFACANLLSGLISRVMAVTEEGNSLEIYTRGFGGIGLFVLGLGVILVLFNREKKKVLSDAN